MNLFFSTFFSFGLVFSDLTLAAHRPSNLLLLILSFSITGCHKGNVDLVCKFNSLFFISDKRQLNYDQVSLFIGCTSIFATGVVGSGLDCYLVSYFALGIFLLESCSARRQEVHLIDTMKMIRNKSPFSPRCRMILTVSGY